MIAVGGEDPRFFCEDVPGDQKGYDVMLVAERHNRIVAVINKIDCFTIVDFKDGGVNIP